MIEALASLLISLVIFAIGYGKLVEKVKSNREVSDSRYSLVQKEIDMLREDFKVLNEIKVTLAELKKDVQHIIERLDDE